LFGRAGNLKDRNFNLAADVVVDVVVVVVTKSKCPTVGFKTSAEGALYIRLGQRPRKQKCSSTKGL